MVNGTHAYNSCSNDGLASVKREVAALFRVEAAQCWRRYSACCGPIECRVDDDAIRTALSLEHGASFTSNYRDKLPALFSARVAFAAVTGFITLFYVEFLVFGIPKERGIDYHIFASAFCTNNSTFCLIHVVLSYLEIGRSRKAHHSNKAIRRAIDSFAANGMKQGKLGFIVFDGD